MNFADVTEWIIPQGDVVEVRDSQNRVIWEKDTSLREPFYVQNITNDVETLHIGMFDVDQTGFSTSFEYLNGDTWETLGTVSLSGGITRTLQPNEKLYLRGNNTTLAPSSVNAFTIIDGVSKVGGNIMSLLYGSSFYSQKEFPNVQDSMGFRNLFYESSNLISASDLKLPANNLIAGCYRQMFRDCTSLTSAPSLPANNLAGYCYYQMFSGCTSLTSAPSLSANTLAEYCYALMFNDCSALSTPPSLPANNLASHCYSSMFKNCTSLNSMPSLSATTLATACYSGMFYGCTLLTSGSSLTLPATVLAPQCYSGMFTNCYNLISTPYLNSTNLSSECYRGMFSGCSSLYIAHPLPATEMQYYCYAEMFNGCTSLEFVISGLPATTLATGCYHQMFKDCTSVRSATLNATTLVTYCYYRMYEGCTLLNNVTCLATSGIGSNDSTYQWLIDTYSTGTFTKAASATWPTGVSGIPSGWTVVDAQ